MPRNHIDRLPDWERRKFIAERGRECAYCGAQGDDWTVNGHPWEVDHIIPIRFGGAPRDWSNLALACRPCNILKGVQSLDALPDRLAHAARMIANRENWPAA